MRVKLQRNLEARLMETQMRVDAARMRIDTQKSLIAELENGDHDGILELANSLLQTFEESQALYKVCERRRSQALRIYK